MFVFLIIERSKILQPRPNVLIATGVAESGGRERAHKTFKLDEIIGVVAIDRIGTRGCIYAIGKIECVRILQPQRIATGGER